MSHIFISYKRESFQFVEKLVDVLKDNGIPTWVDRYKLRGGDDWRSGIDDAIESANGLIVILTQKAAESLYVTYEWSFAIGAGKPVIPILLEPCTIHPRLEALHHIDFTDLRNDSWETLLLSLASLSMNSSHNIVFPRGTPIAIRNAAGQLDNSEPAQRAAAIDTLATSGTAIAEEILAKAIFHSFRDVRLQATIALARNHNLHAIPGIVELLGAELHGLDYRGDEKAILVAGLGQDVIPTVIDCLNNPDEEIRRQAAFVLKELASPLTTKELLDAMQHDKSSTVRAIASHALGRIGNPAIPGLRSALAHHNSHVRQVAANALGDTGQPEVVHDLINILDDPVEQVQKNAANSLRKIGTTDALTAVDKWEADKSTQS